MNFRDCQPVALSLVNVPVASRVPVELHSDPVWVPLLPVPLKNRTPVTQPATLDWNFIPSS